MYQAIEENIIIEKLGEQTTGTGIIIAEQNDGNVFEFLVVATSPQTERLLGKTVYIERRHCQELPKVGHRRFASVSYKNVLAVKA